MVSKKWQNCSLMFSIERCCTNPSDASLTIQACPSTKCKSGIQYMPRQDHASFFSFLVSTLTFLTEKCSVSHGHKTMLINSIHQTNTFIERCAYVHTMFKLISIMQTKILALKLTTIGYKQPILHANASHDYNRWVLLINEETFKGIDGYFRICNLHKVYTVYKFVFPEPLRYLAFLTNREKVQRHGSSFL